MLDALALGREQLDQLGAAVGLVGAEDLTEVGAEVPGVAVPRMCLAHLHSFVSSAPRGLRCRLWELTARAVTPQDRRGGGAAVLTATRPCRPSL